MKKSILLVVAGSLLGALVTAALINPDKEIVALPELETVQQPDSSPDQDRMIDQLKAEIEQLQVASVEPESDPEIEQALNEYGVPDLPVTTDAEQSLPAWNEAFIDSLESERRYEFLAGIDARLSLLRSDVALTSVQEQMIYQALVDHADTLLAFARKTLSGEATDGEAPTQYGNSAFNTPPSYYAEMERIIREQLDQTQRDALAAANDSRQQERLTQQTGHEVEQMRSLIDLSPAQEQAVQQALISIAEQRLADPAEDNDDQLQENKNELLANILDAHQLEEYQQWF
jgi:hypothetical protein